jgi:hypothetical protein
MDFIIGIMLVIIGILLLLNFTTISISDTKFGNESCTGDMQNYLIATMQNNQLPGSPTPVGASGQIGSKAAKVIGGAASYDYSKYFFIS